ncbi:MAG: hypothetical protein Q8L86_14950 [Vicinamibacterales bacterium]|nr:hypothetical protein [Vicinamibacterales bacterium]
MAHRLVIVALWCALAVPGLASAQTLADALAAVDAAVARTAFDTASPSLHRELQAALGVVRQSDALDWSVEDIAEAFAERPRLADIARLSSVSEGRREAVARVRSLDPPLTQAGAIIDNDLTELLIARAGSAEAGVVLAPWTRFYAALLERSRDESLEKLRRYERKFGPGSARLNGAEVLLNYTLQNLPGFGPDAQEWPGRFEAVAAYSSSYITWADDEARMASVGEFGLRAYFFSESWGRSGLPGLLRPAFATVGLAVANEREGPLRWPWKGDARVGAFLTWGEVKVAYVGGTNARLLVSRQFQFLPLVF